MPDDFADALIFSSVRTYRIPSIAQSKEYLNRWNPKKTETSFICSVFDLITKPTPFSISMTAE